MDLKEMAGQKYEVETSGDISLESFKDRCWRVITKGPLFYVTVPIFLLSIIIVFFATMISGGTEISFAVARAFSEKTTVLTKQELEVLNEWILVIETSDSYEDAVRSSQDFLKAYKKLGAGIWDQNVLYVRDPNSAGTWLVVVDVWSGASSCQNIQQEIVGIWDESQKTRDLRDSLGMWVYASYATEFGLKEFEEQHGKALNNVDWSSHPRNPDSSCSPLEWSLSGGPSRST